MSKIETILIVEYKQIDDYKSTHNVVHSNAKSIIYEWNIDEAFQSMRQNFIKKIENFGIGDWIINLIMEHSIYVCKSNPPVL